jgi:hypothetical protein
MRDLRAALLVCSLCSAWLPACSEKAPASGPPSEPASEVARPEAPSVAPPPAAAPVEAEPSLASVISAVLDSRPMTMYLHPEVEGRVPVAITGPALAGATIEAVAQGQPVRVRAEAEAAADPEAPCVIFDRITVEGTTAEIELRYPIEGILGRFVLERERTGWRIVKAELAER